MKSSRAFHILNFPSKYKEEQVREAHDFYAKHMAQVLCPKCKERYIARHLKEQGRHCFTCHFTKDIA